MLTMYAIFLYHITFTIYKISGYILYIRINRCVVKGMLILQDNAVFTQYLYCRGQCVLIVLLQ